jgi:hypothetical protein
MEKQIRTGGQKRLLGPLSSTRSRVLSTGYPNPIKSLQKCKNRFVKNPLSTAASGQNKTLKLCQNNVVINTSS